MITRLISFGVLSAAFALSFASAALAQKAGTYSGLTADGNTVSFTVTGTTGNFTLGSANVGFIADCAKTGNSVTEGWGFFLGTPIVGSSTDFLSHNDYYWINGNAMFPHPNTMKGMITSITATFDPKNDPPTAAQFCKSPKQAFTATFQMAPGGLVAAPGTAVVVSRAKAGTVEPAK